MFALLLLLASFSPVSMDVASPPEDGDAINRMCPIGDEPIDGSTVATHDGHTIGFCCPGCDGRFLAWDEAKKDAFVEASLAAVSASPSTEPVVAAPVSEPYTLAKCAVSGRALGSMGEPVVITVEGRELRLCCDGCVKTAKTETERVLASVDAALIADQRASYPMTTCVVSDEPLTEDGEDIAKDVILGNRLFRVCCGGCIKSLKSDTAGHLAKLDAAVIASQRADYPLTTCLVRENSELGSMGKPSELVVANRLLRFCCAGCHGKFSADPAPFLARLDEAWAPIHSRKVVERQAAEESKADRHRQGEHDGHGG